MNLAKWKYSRVLKEFGGPIEKISIREIDFFGEKYFEAYAYLDLKSIPFLDQKKSIYGSSHGSGTDSKKDVAIYKSISEALERWAWGVCSSEKQDGKRPVRAGVDVSPNTDGFAAFPGLFPSSPREAAMAEAIERWAICGWWEKRFGNSSTIKMDSEIYCIEIFQDRPNFTVALCWKDYDFGRVYGFACSKGLSNAIAKAKVELHRNCRVLENHHQHQKSDGNVYNLNEKRILAFSSSSGKSLFEKRIQSGITTAGKMTNLIIDEAVIGDWTKYSHVWRCLFDASEFDSSRFDENTVDYFCF